MAAAVHPCWRLLPLSEASLRDARLDITENRGLARPVDRIEHYEHIRPIRKPAWAFGEIDMKVRLILTGMIAGLLVPLAAANGGTVFNPGLNQAGAGIDLARGAAPIADNYWRTVDKDDKDDKGDHDRDCDKSPSKDRDCKDH